VKATRLTMIHEDVSPEGRTFTRRTVLLIIETSSGEVEIVREGQPLIDADRSCAVTVKGYDVILEVERADR
jgi:hypothetical protein